MRRIGNDGYSLIQMAVAMAIGATLIGTAVPVTGEYLRRYRLSSGTGQVAYDLSRARMQAVAQRAFVRIRFPDSSHYVRERSTDNVTFVADGPVLALPSGVSASGVTAVTFQRDGMLPVAVTLTVSNGGLSKTVRANVLGRVTVS
jgi:Tfp pilus assembly protein FimT